MNLAEQVEVLKDALTVIATSGGRLTDDQLTSPNTYPNKGILFVNARRIALSALGKVSEASPEFDLSTQEATNAEIMRKRDAGMVFDHETGEWGDDEFTKGDCP